MATNPSPEADCVFHRRESGVRSYCRHFNVVFRSARGSLMRDAAGREYIDFLAGCASLNYGHNDPDMKQALVEHILNDGIAHGLDLFTTAKQSFLETFEKLILEPRGLDYRLQFTGPTGTNAVEAALKLARKVTGRTNVVAFTNGFHGVSLGSLAATGNRHHRMGPVLPLHGVSRVPFDGYLGPDFDTADLLDRMLSDPSSGLDAPAAILLETVQGEGGLNAAGAPWVRRLARLAERHGALFIVDDIQAGCGRTGTFFSFEALGVVPDLVVLSKSLSGFGLPMALLLIRPQHDAWRPGEHNGTFRGNTHAFVTARVALRKFWSDGAFAAATQAKASRVRERLSGMAEMIPGSRIKGRGMMIGLDVGSGELADRICHHCFGDGLIIETSGAHDEVVKILAPLTTPDDLLERGLDILENAVHAAAHGGRAAAE
ncbi:diaminobutyrate--2-oxoglutarate transaminase (plasmid) [Skermanella mucosa]|uniref:diaminobutyrate--2-oxoglutarate transaminase n=1 Tax=Skermanella mucosa TaxID=1789672 RepID=UPI00192ABF61|nr:diaminobutyrate--2-oxoglutarate transaminase [Skermanella mucosa]UEM24897.1 diaminobutyrate--2-oxoglutarate transaminase [Skermanella mucosa]